MNTSAAVSSHFAQHHFLLVAATQVLHFVAQRPASQPKGLRLTLRRVAQPGIA